MSNGRPRYDILPGTIIGSWKIIERSKKIYREGHLNYEYLYDVECRVCGYLDTRRTTHMKDGQSHIGCPALNEYMREIGRKNISPGTFHVFMKERYQIE